MKKPFLSWLKAGLVLPDQMKSIHSQSSANRVSEGREDCEQHFWLSVVFSAWTAAAAPKKNAAARRIAIMDLVDSDKRFMVISPFIFLNEIIISGFLSNYHIIITKMHLNFEIFCKQERGFSGMGVVPAG